MKKLSTFVFSLTLTFPLLANSPERTEMTNKAPSVVGSRHARTVEQQRSKERDDLNRKNFEENRMDSESAMLEVDEKNR